jgi:hypothetical protein
MGSHFMRIHPIDLPTLGRVLGSNDPELLGMLCPKAGASPKKKAARAMRDLISGAYATAYPRGEEHPDAAYLIQALEGLCRHLGGKAIAIEMYDDEDESPELCHFIWDGGNPLGLPHSPDGVPAVTWRGPSEIANHLAIFTDLKSAGTWNTRFLPAAELDGIIRDLERAQDRSQGVFVFVDY